MRLAVGSHKTEPGTQAQRNYGKGRPTSSFFVVLQGFVLWCVDDTDHAILTVFTLGAIVPDGVGVIHNDREDGELSWRRMVCFVSIACHLETS